MTTDDDVLLARLGRALAPVDPPPASVVAAAKASFALRDLDGELAALVFDSAAEREPVGVRGGGASRLLSFEADEAGVELEVAGTDRRLVGQLVPPSPAEIELRDPEGSRTVAADHLGRFAVDAPAHGPVQLRWRTGGRLTRTDWVLL